MGSRLRAIFIGLVAFSGCAGPESDYRPQGKPALGLQVRRATTQPIDGWQPYKTGTKGDQTIFVSPEVVLANRDLASTGARRDENGLWAIAIKLNEPASRRFAMLTDEMVASRGSQPTPPEQLLAFFVDGELLSAPQLTDRISNGTFNLMGHFSHSESELEARRIARGLVQSE
jgi:preprotein translocase subunit SecD